MYKNKLVKKWFWLTVKQYSWAPILVFTVHLIAFSVFRIYYIWPEFDTPMHILGGFSIAYFLNGAYLQAGRNKLIGQPGGIVQIACVFGMTSSVIIFWEFAELFSDRFLGTRVQGGVGETLLDMFFGMLGAALFIVFFQKRTRSND